MASETMIDLVFSSRWKLRCVMNPDHSAVIVYRNEKLIENKNSIIICRDYKRMNVEEFKRMISSYLSTIGGDSIDY